MSSYRGLKSAGTRGWMSDGEKNWENDFAAEPIRETPILQIINTI